MSQPLLLLTAWSFFVFAPGWAGTRASGLETWDFSPNQIPQMPHTRSANLPRADACLIAVAAYSTPTHTPSHSHSAVKHNNIWFQFRFWFWFSVNHLKLTFFWSPHGPLNENGFKFVFYLCNQRASLASSLAGNDQVYYAKEMFGWWAHLSGDTRIGHLTQIGWFAGQWGFQMSRDGQMMLL